MKNPFAAAVRPLTGLLDTPMPTRPIAVLSSARSVSEVEVEVELTVESPVRCRNLSLYRRQLPSAASAHVPSAVFVSRLPYRRAVNPRVRRWPDGPVSPGVITTAVNDWRATACGSAGSRKRRGDTDRPAVPRGFSGRSAARVPQVAGIRTPRTAAPTRPGLPSPLPSLRVRSERCPPHH